MISLAERFKAGFTLGHGIETDEILLDEKRTQGHVLAFLCYDANMYPAPDISTWSALARSKVLDSVRRHTNAVNAEVWVDSVKVKDYIEGGNSGDTD
ncbi:hypothetical protein [Lacticaseibacillus daqingensis]|uniref:hypothetical protein n=1 Tax=Lacticaseibacillus daqingensis TaxID=2486014 RepID=UPI001CDD123D|nr:hypothetical protein [Lacticaseibacillus daqingensis]